MALVVWWISSPSLHVLQVLPGCVLSLFWHWIQDLILINFYLTATATCSLFFRIAQTKPSYRAAPSAFHMRGLSWAASDPLKREILVYGLEIQAFFASGGADTSELNWGCCLSKEEYLCSSSRWSFHLERLIFNYDVGCFSFIPTACTSVPSTAFCPNTRKQFANWYLTILHDVVIWMSLLDRDSALLDSSVSILWCPMESGKELSSSHLSIQTEASWRPVCSTLTPLLQRAYLHAG